MTVEHKFLFWAPWGKHELGAPWNSFVHVKYHVACGFLYPQAHQSEWNVKDEHNGSTIIFNSN
jgi:hypothetical protein